MIYFLFILKYIFVDNAFICQKTHTNNAVVTLYTTALLCFPKTLYPGGIRTRVFLFQRRIRCLLRHAARAQEMLYCGTVLNPFVNVHMSVVSNP
jgi:hypothetical protein